MDRPTYSGIPQGTDEKDFDESVDTSSIQREYTEPTSRSQVLILSFVIHIILLFACASLFVGAILTSSGSISFEGHGSRSRLGDLVNEYHPHRFQLNFADTPYKGPPSPSVDKAWAELVEDNAMIVPDEDLPTANFSVHNPVRGSNDKDSGVLAKFEGYHALHCVNLLWKHTWPDYYTEEQAELERDPDFMHIHLDHCADLLRQTIQCNMDFSILTYYENHNKIWADFNILHQCQDFDKPKKYMEEHRFRKEIDRLDPGRPHDHIGEDAVEGP